MTHSGDEVIASAKAMFGEDGLAEVLAALDGYGTERHEIEVNRVKLAILRLSEGRTDKLLYWIKTAKADYRDPLAALELGPISPEEGAKLQEKAKILADRFSGK